MNVQESVELVVRRIGNAFNTGTVFEGPEECAAIRAAEAAGFVSLLQGERRPFTMRDESGAIFGIVLTPDGLSHLGRNETNYYKKQ